MPALPRLRIEALADLARQLRFAPPATARRQMDRAAALASRLDPALNYPEDWLIYKITGYRPRLAEPAMLVGSALLADMPALVERLSVGAALREPDLPRGKFLTLQALAARWKVTPRTIERRRRDGLLAVRYRGPGGRTRLAFPVPSVMRMEGLRRAPRRPHVRMTRAEREQALRRGERYRRAGLSLNEAAVRVSRRLGRAVQTVRVVLERDGVLRRPPRLSPQDIQLIEQAEREAREPSVAARALGRQLPAIRRLLRQRRADRLRALALPVVVTPPAAPGRGRPMLEGLGAPAPTTLAGLLQAARDMSPPAAAAERALATAYRSLRDGAAAAITALPRRGCGATALDRIETDLRTAARLRAELVRSQLPLMLRTIDAAYPSADLPASALAPLVESCLAALAEAADDFNPGARARGGRLAAPSGLALTRVVTRWAAEHPALLSTVPGRASRRGGGDAPVPDFTARVAPWQAFLDPPPRARAALPTLPARERDFLVLRYGWSGPAHTLTQIATLYRTTLIKAVLLERRALRAALRAAPRDGGAP